MMNTSPKILFFGNERLATGATTTAPTLRALIAEGYDIQAVILNNETAVSRKNRKLEIAEVAKEHGIPVLYPSKLSESVDELSAFGAQAAVLAAYGKIVPQTVIDIFPAGIVNIHPSALPKHRGPTPVESIILEGATETAVSLMQLVRAMDAGPVFAQRTTSVPNGISKQDLCDQLLQIGSEMVVQYLPSILDGTLKPTPQDEALATYDSLINKSDGQVDWTKPAEQLEREIRAYAEWPKSTAKVGQHELIIKAADVVKTSGKAGDYTATRNELIVYCGQDALSLKQIQPVNKKEMPVAAFLSGYSL